MLGFARLKINVVWFYPSLHVERDLQSPVHGCLEKSRFYLLVYFLTFYLFPKQEMDLVACCEVFKINSDIWTGKLSQRTLKPSLVDLLNKLKKNTYSCKVKLCTVYPIVCNNKLIKLKRVTESTQTILTWFNHA